jgi:Hpt domain
MKQPDDRPDPTTAVAAPDDEFERLREAFRGRLRSDRTRLTTLGASLARSEGSSVGSFCALQTLAHRIRGTAAIFEEAKLSSDAHALEQAATHACDTGSDHADGAVRSTLEALVERLTLHCGSDVVGTRTETAPKHR